MLRRQLDLGGSSPGLRLSETRDDDDDGGDDDDDDDNDDNKHIYIYACISMRYIYIYIVYYMVCIYI